jgi:cytochrome c oxidase cbb3-type subunit 1
LVLVVGVISLGMGYSQGREYAELPWAVDMMIAGLFGLVIFNLFMTVRRRQESILYVSIWYACAAVILTAVGYCLGNVIWKPDSGALLGIPDAILLWFYGHNIFGLLLTPLALGWPITSCPWPHAVRCTATPCP